MNKQVTGSGRRKRTPLVEKYPGWPDLSPESVDPVARKCLLFVLNLKDAVDDLSEAGHTQSLRDFARQAGINHATLIAITAGRTWPDGETIAKLESMTGRSLWPSHEDENGDRRLVERDLQ